MATIATNEQMKNEAISRMEMLGIIPSVRKVFQNKGSVYYSEHLSSFFDGILFFLDNNDDYIKIKNDFEKEYGGLVYHAQLSHTTLGDMLTLLYVTKDPSCWNEDKRMLKQGDTYAYVYNLSDPDLSEIGMVGIKAKNGGVTRVY